MRQNTKYEHQRGYGKCPCTVKGRKLLRKSTVVKLDQLLILSNANLLVRSKQRNGHERENHQPISYDSLGGKEFL